MNIFITDTGTTPVRPLKNDIVLREEKNMRSCTGCLDCWLKTPGICIMHDRLQHFGAMLSRCDRLIIVSRCVYGSMSPFARRVLERGISSLQPAYGTKSGRLRVRHPHRMTVSAYFYGEDLSEEEKTCARTLIADNAAALGARTGSIMFLRDAAEIGGY